MRDIDDFSRTPEGEKVRAVLKAAPPPKADPTFRRALGIQFASGKFAERPHAVPRPRRQPHWTWFAVPAAAAALVALTFLNRGSGWEVLQAPAGAAVLVDGEALSRAGLAAGIAGGGEIGVPAGATLTLRHASGIVVQADSGTVMTLPAPPGRWFRRGIHAKLDRGEMRIVTGAPFSGRLLAVATPEGLTEVPGTALSVVRDEQVTCVCVMIGEARVGTGLGHMDPVQAGMRKVLFRDGRPPMITTIEPTHASGLAAFIAQYGARTPSALP